MMCFASVRLQVSINSVGADPGVCPMGYKTGMSSMLFGSSTVEHTKLGSSTATTGNAANSTLKE